MKQIDHGRHSIEYFGTLNVAWLVFCWSCAQGRHGWNHDISISDSLIALDWMILTADTPVFRKRDFHSSWDFPQQNSCWKQGHVPKLARAPMLLNWMKCSPLHSGFLNFFESFRPLCFWLKRGTTWDAGEVSSRKWMEATSKQFIAVFFFFFGLRGVPSLATCSSFVGSISMWLGMLKVWHMWLVIYLWCFQTWWLFIPLCLEDLHRFTILTHFKGLETTS